MDFTFEVEDQSSRSTSTSFCYNEHTLDTRKIKETILLGSLVVTTYMMCSVGQIRVGLASVDSFYKMDTWLLIKFLILKVMLIHAHVFDWSDVEVSLVCSSRD